MPVAQLPPPPARRGRSWGLIASLLIHAALLWALGERPPAAIPAAQWTPVELVELPPARVDPEPSRPAPAPVLPTPDPTPGEPERAVDSPASDTPVARGPAEEGGPPASSPDLPENPGTGPAIALRGLRGQSRASAGPVPAPSVELGRRKFAPKVASDQSVDQPARAPDSKPRSLAEAGFKRRRDGTMVYRHKMVFRAILFPDGRVEFQNLPGIPVLTPTPGLSEAVRAAHGEELYRQAKRKLLADTEDLRLGMAIAFAESKIDERLSKLYRELLTAWGRTSTPAADRRRLLFERWDECEESFTADVPEWAEDDRSRIDKVRTNAADKARRTIESFIRKQLPAGSESAFSAKELEACNRRRRSRQRFDPYRQDVP